MPLEKDTRRIMSRNPTRRPRLLSRVEPRSSFNNPNQSATESSQACLAFKQKTNKQKTGTTKQKLVLITFLTIHNYPKLTSTEGGKGAIPTGLVSHECMRVGAGHLSLLPKQILIFNL